MKHVTCIDYTPSSIKLQYEITFFCDIFLGWNKTSITSIFRFQHKSFTIFYCLCRYSRVTWQIKLGHLFHVIIFFFWQLLIEIVIFIKKYKYMVLWSIIQYTRHFSKITNLHKFRYFIVHFFSILSKSQKSQSLETSFRRIWRFFDENSIQKKTYIWGENGWELFFCLW